MEAKKPYAPDKLEVTKKPVVITICLSIMIF